MTKEKNISNDVGSLSVSIKVKRYLKICETAVDYLNGKEINWDEFNSHEIDLIKYSDNCKTIQDKIKYIYALHFYSINIEHNFGEHSFLFLLSEAGRLKERKNVADKTKVNDEILVKNVSKLSYDEIAYLAHNVSNYFKENVYQFDNFGILETIQDLDNEKKILFIEYLKMAYSYYNHKLSNEEKEMLNRLFDEIIINLLEKEIMNYIKKGKDELSIQELYKFLKGTYNDTVQEYDRINENKEKNNSSLNLNNRKNVS